MPVSSSTPLTHAQSQRRPRRTAITVAAVACGALLGPLLAVQPATSADEGAVASASRSPLQLAVRGRQVAGAPVTLVARVRPKRKGRVVVFAARPARKNAKWRVVGRARTTRAGIARTTTRFRAAGRHQVRAVARKHGKQRVRVTARTIRIAPRPTPRPPKSNTDGKAATLFAPERVTTGSTFDLVVEVGVKRGLRGAGLTITAPKQGRQVVPPNDVTIKNGKGVASLNIVPHGQPRTITLRWKAPAKPGTLTAAADLTATGIKERLTTTIQVLKEPAGSYQVNHDHLVRFRAVDPLSTDPDKLNAVCFPTGKGPVPTFPAAVKAAQNWITTQQSGVNKNAWKNNPQAKTSTGLLRLFAMANLENRPSAMLAMALRGHQLAPTDARHLVNAGMAANVIGQHGWAIAFLTKAHGLPLAPAAGMPLEAARLNNLANAHARMGNTTQALTHLRHALLLDPENPLLEHQLATYLACDGRKPDALDHLRSAHREHDTPDEVEMNDQSWADSHRVLDMSASQQGSLVLRPIPRSLEELLAVEESVRTELADLAAQHRELSPRNHQLSAQHVARMSSMEPAEYRRGSSLLTRVSGTNSVASREVQDAYTAMMAANADLRDFCYDAPVRNHPHCTIDTSLKDYTCADHQALLDFWRQRANAARDAIHRYYAVAWPTWTGVQGNIHDPLLHELAGVRMQLSVHQITSAFITDISTMAHRYRTYNHSAKGLPSGATCVDPNPPPPADEPTKSKTPLAPACDENIARASLNLNLKVAKIAVNCESVTAGAETGIGLLTGFAQVQVGATKSTAMIGSKISVSGIGGSMGSIAFDSAIYVEFDGRGRLADIGWEVGPSVTIGSGPLQLKGYEDKVRFTFLNFHEGLGL